MSTLNYAGDAYNHASGTRDAFGALSDALVAEGHPAMKVVDGDREKQDQLNIWYDRMTLNPGGRKVYGTAWWQGQKWYRIHPDAVGVPDTSNHEKRRANDLAWPYNSNTAAHRRAQELAPNYGITCEGMSFGEWWHWTFWGELGAIGAAGGSATAAPNQSEEDEMKPDSMAANVDGVTSWCWLNWAKGTIFAVHTQADADIVSAYMGSVNDDWFPRADGGQLYKNKLALFGILCPNVTIERRGLTDEDFARLEAMVAAGVRAALTGASH